MNVSEFGEVFTKPLYYSALSGIILAAIVLVRVNFASRHSITWYGIKTAIRFLKRSEYDQTKMTRYSDFKMSGLSFALWQAMKVILFAPLFSNLIFGMTVEHLAQGNDIGLRSIGSIFIIPFAEVPMDGTFAQETVVPMFPALTLLIPSLLAATSLRLLLYVGASGTVSIISQYMIDAREAKPRFLSYISTIEIIVGVTILWLGFNLFFSFAIDYNTRYAIAGTIALGSAFIAYGLLDRRRAKVIIYPTKRHMYSRLLTAVVVVVLTVSVMAINNSIADAQKIEWRGPYTAQEIAVNRYMHDLERIGIVNYDIVTPSVTPSTVQAIVDENRETLTNIRLWDQVAARSKLTPELGQRNDLHYVDTDILRFGGTMYWTGTTTPNLPQNVAQTDKWFSEHLIYTHANPGMKMLEADTGNIVDEAQFFEQRRIYYGESDETGLFDKVWSAYPLGRTESREVDQFFYNGTGGVDVWPPLSWMFEPNFMLSSPSTPIHVMRYKDVHERMELLYPYFVYDFGFGSSSNPQFKPIDINPVTDGENTYWLMPLVAALDTSHVPWSSNFMLKLVGYAIIDTYNGDTRIIVTGDDYFSKIMLERYRSLGATDQVPEWLSEQVKYPEEMFIWTISKFNTYHVTDPKTFIEARQFYSIPEDDTTKPIPPYYITTKPPGFDDPAFVGFQSLELSGSQPKNLVGYMIVRNDLDGLGEMTFFSVPGDSQVKLLGPTGAKDSLDRDKDYKSLKTLLNNPRTGEYILYRIGDHEVYFVPVYTSNTGGGVVSQTGTIAAVGGASVTGTYYVGLGDNPVDAFRDYLLKLSGVVTDDQPSTGNQTGSLDKETRIQKIEKVFADLGLTVVKPTAISAPLAFREVEATYEIESDYAAAEALIQGFVRDFGAGQPMRVFEWQDETRINFGFLVEVNGIVENHYIAIEVG
jgi:hypothetical protein